MIFLFSCLNTTDFLKALLFLSSVMSVVDSTFRPRRNSTVLSSTRSIPVEWSRETSIPAKESLARPSLATEVLQLAVDPVQVQGVVRRMLPLDVLVSALSP